MAENTKLIVFDLDGTLVNSIPDLTTAMNTVLAAQGFPQHDETAFLQFVGNGARKIVERALPPKSPDELITRCLDLFNAEYASVCCCNTYAYSGMANLLEQLAALKLFMAVLSNKPQAMTEDVVRHCFGNVFFDAVEGAKPHAPLKPAPDQLLQLADSCHVTMDQVVLIGDSDVDCQTAQNAACRFIGVTWGFRSRELLLQNGASDLAETPNDILNFFR